MKEEIQVFLNLYLDIMRAITQESNNTVSLLRLRNFQDEVFHKKIEIFLWRKQLGKCTMTALTNRTHLT
jgi:hypothetical protein